MSEEKASDLPPWHEVMPGNKLRRYKTNPERELDVPDLRVIEPVNNRFAVAVEYQSDCLLK